MSEQAERALSDYEAALKRLGRANGAKDEGEYGKAYQRLVRLGIRPQLRGKYRT